MKRFRQFIVNTLTMVSLLLCLAMVALWDASVFNKVQWTLLETSDLQAWINVSDGEFAATYMEEKQSLLFQPDVHFEYAITSDWLNRRGFVWNKARHQGKVKGFLIACPMWAIIGLTALLPIGSIARRFLRKPSVPGICRACGYDLRATPDRCPECGTIPATVKA